MCMYDYYRVETDCSESASGTDCPSTPSLSTSVDMDSDNDSESPTTCGRTSSASHFYSPPMLSATSTSDGQIDLGTLVQAAAGSWDRLTTLVNVTGYVKTRHIGSARN